MKKNTGFIVAIAILSFLLLISIGGNIFGFIKYQLLDKECQDVYNRRYYNKSRRVVPQTNSKTTSNVKTYGFNYAIKVVGVNKQLYMIESDGSKNAGSDQTCVNEIVKGVTFDAHGKYSCKTEGLTANKLYIDEDNVLKVKVLHRESTGDISTDVFIIFKDGKVKQTGTDAYLKDVFTDYKVKDVREYCAVKDSAGNCTMAGYVLTLLDGKTTRALSLK